MTPDDRISRTEVLDILHNAHEFYQSETAISVVPLLHVIQLIESLPAAAPVVPSDQPRFTDEQWNEWVEEDARLRATVAELRQQLSIVGQESIDAVIDGLEHVHTVGRQRWGMLDELRDALLDES